jgi:hypothetical protein
VLGRAETSTQSTEYTPPCVLDRAKTLTQSTGRALACVLDGAETSTQSTGRALARVLGGAASRHRARDEERRRGYPTGGRGSAPSTAVGWGGVWPSAANASTGT